MRPVGSIADLLTWRLRLARTGLVLRMRRLFSILVMFGGVGVAMGYSVVARLSRDLDDDEAETRRSKE
jgi:hypothetical protein